MKAQRAYHIIESKQIKQVSPAQVRYQYKYNGKELQDELGFNWYDYGARNYQADLGRWMNIDPLAEHYYDKSLYLYSINNPVFFKDPNGQEIDVTEIANSEKKGDNWLLLNLMISLADISGKKINYSVNDDGKHILTGSGEGNDSEASKYVSHLLDEGNTITVHNGSDKGSEGFRDGNIFLDAGQINGMQKALKKNGFDPKSVSVGFAFLHETLHTKYGADFFNSDADNKEKQYGRFLDNGTTGPAVDRINAFRKKMKLPIRYRYGSKGTLYFEKDGNKKIIKYRRIPITNKEDNKADEKIFDFNND